MTIDEMIAVLQAAKEGKTIQWRHGACEWQDSKIDTLLPTIEYRVKPEPREIWVNIYPNGEPAYAHDSEAMAIKVARSDRIRTVKFREVID